MRLDGVQHRVGEQHMLCVSGFDPSEYWITAYETFAEALSNVFLVSLNVKSPVRYEITSYRKTDEMWPGGEMPVWKRIYPNDEKAKGKL